ncbi:MAG TPA: tetratricopeptide repeat protein [Patescibacteria group bacterium]|nr:tetratricopeptide repeat protein [Patescibacteria group bacterium]
MSRKPNETAGQAPGDLFLQVQQLLAAGRMAEADPLLETLAKTLRRQTTAVDECAFYNLGVLFRTRGDLRAARDFFERAVRRQPRDSRFQSALGNVLRAAGHTAEATVVYQRALMIDPDNVMILSNLGYLLARQGQLAEAIELFSRALALVPEDSKEYSFIRRNRYHAIFRMGDFGTGFAEAECRLDLPDYRSLFSWVEHIPRWQGETFAGKSLLVHHEQGFGDAIQFVRYLPDIRERCDAGSQIILTTEQPLLRLFTGLPGVDRLIKHSQASIAAAAADLRVSVLSLPALLGPRPELGANAFYIPDTFPYLSVKKEWRAAWCGRIGQETPQVNETRELRVGLVWAASSQHQGEQLEGRSCGLQALAPLAAVPGVVFYSLQKGEAAPTATDIPAGMTLRDHTADITDFADTAALIAELDLVLSVDTSVAHLAGALGKPVWTLLPFDQNWRWVSGQTDTWWYPAMRLFQQEKPGEWKPVIRRVCRELTALQRSFSAAERQRREDVEIL